MHILIHILSTFRKVTVTEGGDLYMFDLMPFRDRDEDVVETFFNLINNFFEQNGLSLFDDQVNSIRTDIKESPEAYFIEVELPRFTNEDITIGVNNNQLTIRVTGEYLKEAKDDSDKLIRQERRYGEFVRQFYVDNIKEDEIDAQREDDILKIIIPKKI